MTGDQPFLRIKNVSVTFDVGGGMFTAAKRHIQAVNNVSLDISKGDVFGIVGESGSGKTTLGRAILGLVPLSAGRIEFDGTLLADQAHVGRRPAHKRMSLVFQDPFGSLNPRMTIGRLIAEPMVIRGMFADRKTRTHKVAELLRTVGLGPEMAKRYPHEFSGGQRQRIGIARALAGEPEFLVLDEPVSALDVSIQAQILTLLDDVRQQVGFTSLFIAHDIAVVCQFATRVAVMYLGRLVEMTDNYNLHADPIHPYTKALVAAVPIPDPIAERARKPVPIIGEIPDASNPPSGCVYRTRCPLANARCRTDIPALTTIADGRMVACHAFEEGRITNQGAEQPI